MQGYGTCIKILLHRDIFPNGGLNIGVHMEFIILYLEVLDQISICSDAVLHRGSRALCATR